MAYKVKSQMVDIVFLGRFNPSIFQPMWFSSHGLLREEEADEAEIGLIHPEVTTAWYASDVTMLNLLKFKPEGGLARYMEYGAAVAPLLEKVQGKSTFMGLTQEQLIGGDNADWELQPRDSPMRPTAPSNCVKRIGESRG